MVWEPKDLLVNMWLVNSSHHPLAVRRGGLDEGEANYCGTIVAPEVFFKMLLNYYLCAM